MGCAQSRIENEESVARCKERKQLMKDAVSARNAFAAAHSSYTISLKNTGAALSDFAQADAAHTHQSPLTAAAHNQIPHPSSSSSSQTIPNPLNPSSTSGGAPIESLPPPPPPLPDFSPSPLSRSASMPEIPQKFSHSSKSPVDPTIQEGDDEAHRVEEEEEDSDVVVDDDDDDDDDDDKEVEQVIHKPLQRNSNSNEDKKKPPPEPHSESEPPPPPPPDSGTGTWDFFFANYEGGLHSEEIEEPVTPEKGVMKPPPPPPPIETPTPPPVKEKREGLPPRPEMMARKKEGMVHHVHAASASAVETRKGKAVERLGVVVGEKRSVSLLQVLVDLDDHFLKASESAHEVSKMLEANRMHYHSNFADNRGHIDHSARVMRVITWNRSFKGMHNADDRRDDFENDEWETHATVLDKMLAWEKKLYEEVKAGELMKIEYQRKVALLNKQKKRHASSESIEKTKAAVSHLHTRYIVDMQSLDSTVHEIQHLRDDQLYPRLVDLVNGMAKMWDTMYSHHDTQLKIVNDIRALDVSNTMRETSEHHYGRTEQLYDVVREWHLHFQKLISHQKEYILALHSWLKLNIIPIESSLKEKVSSPPRVHHPPIQSLLLAWHEHMEKLPDDLARSAIQSFSAVINTIMLLQQDEFKQKNQCEEIRKEYIKKSRAFEDWHHKYSQKKAGMGEEGGGENTEGGNQNDLVAEREFVVESLKKKLDSEIEAYQKLCRQVREKSLGSLKTHLPELFRALSDFAFASSEMYKKLGSIAAQNSEAN